MKFELRHQFALVIAIVIAVIDFLALADTGFFIPILFVALTIGWLQFWLDYFEANQRQKDIETRFPEFVRNLTGAIKSGMPISRAIVYVSNVDYGPLTPHIKKVSNQVEWAIPVHKALTTLGNDTNNPVIKRAIATVIEAEQAGGNIEDVLESITSSLISIKMLKSERKSTVHAQVMQSYIIFIVFLGVLIIIQNVLMPYITNMNSMSFTGGSPSVKGASSGLSLIKVSIDLSSPFTLINSLKEWFSGVYGVFLMLSVIQGLFTGLVIGKLSEGQISAGVRHSLILISIAVIVLTLAQKFV